MSETNALKSTYRGVSDGTLQVVDLNFVVFPEDAIRVYLDGDEHTSGFTFERDITPQRVTFDAPIPEGVDVIIRRNSDLSELPHVFHYTGNIKGGAEFNSKNMDENFAKILRASEDAMDSFELVGINVEAAVDANLAADRAEAAAEDAEQSYQNTLAYGQQGEQWMLAAQAAAVEAEGSKNAARASEQAAKASEQASASSESNAKDSELLAEGYAEDAATSESNALSYKQDSETARNQALNYRNDAWNARDAAQQHQQSTEAYKDAAASSASQANASAQSAESSKDLAYRWANEPEDQPVEQGEFSAYHWAKKAQEFVGGPYLRVSNNLSEVVPEVARDNLGLGSAAGANVVQSTGNSEDDVMSQQAVTDALNTKNTQGTGSSQTRTNSQNDSRFIRGGSVVQSTGSSTTNVMSQKAVTDALNEKADSADLGSAAGRDVVSSSTDTSGGNKVITQGWMGLGGKSRGIQIPSSGSDLNDYQHTGFYSQSTWGGAANGSNYPQNSAGCLFVYPTAGNNGVGQTFYTYKGMMYIRYFEDGSWGSWREIHHTGNFPPIGMTYTQYPGTDTPSTLFGGTWTLMFNSEGVFFRTEGQGASSFGGGIQNDQFRSHTHTAQGLVSSPGGFGGGDSGWWRGEVTTSSVGGSETRPRNRTIRVWRKTAH